jgi:hypothetical protein
MIPALSDPFQPLLSLSCNRTGLARVSLRRVAYPLHYRAMDNEKPEWRCDRCGFPMVERQCKVICPNCGQRWDCSDVTIWTGDGRPRRECKELRGGAAGHDCPAS